MNADSRISRKLFAKTYRMLLLTLFAPTLLLGLIISGALLWSGEKSYENAQTVKMETAASYLESTWDVFYSVSRSSLLQRNLAALAAADRSKLTPTFLQSVFALQGYLDAAAAGDTLTDIYLYIDNPGYLISRTAAWNRPDKPPAAFNSRTFLYNFADRITQSGEESFWTLHEGDIYYCRRVNDLYDQPAYVFEYRSSVSLAARLRSLLSDSARRYRMLILDGGQVLHDSDMLLTGRAFDTANLSGYDARARVSALQGWTYLLLTERAPLVKSRFVICGATAALAVALFLLCAWIARRLTASINKPYSIIAELLRAPVKDAAERYKAEYAPHDELGMIHELIYQTKYELFTAQNELTESRRAFQSAQNIALQTQINPHFLYNTLETVNWRVYEKLPEDFEISGMIQKLSLLLRLSLESGETLVPLSREIKHVRAYLDIQHERYKDAFTEIWDVADDALCGQVVRLSLQPLFENAILYGVREIPGGVIALRARRDGEKLIVSVSDNGPGLSPEAVRRLNERLGDSRGVKSDHIGLVNVNTRVQLIFGAEYGLTVESEPLVETKITMTLPFGTERSAPWDHIE